MKVGTTALGDDDRRGCTITKPPIAAIRCSTGLFLIARTKPGTLLRVEILSLDEITWRILQGHS